MHPNFLEHINLPKKLYYSKKTEESFTNEQDLVLVRAIIDGYYGKWKEIHTLLKGIKKFRFNTNLPAITINSVEKRVDQLLRYFIAQEFMNPDYFDIIMGKAKEISYIETASTTTPDKSIGEFKDPKQKTLPETFDKIENAKEIVEPSSSKTKSKPKPEPKEKITKKLRQENPSSSTKKKPKPGRSTSNSKPKGKGIKAI